MAINKKLIVQEAAAAVDDNTTEEGLILDLDATDVDSYDGDGDVWYDIKDHEYTPTTDVSENFNTVIWTGDASTRSIAGVGFEPDLVWIRNRTSTSGYNHGIFDSIRGANKVISSNNTDSENQYGNWTQQLTSFDSDGFSLGDNSDSGNYVNLSGDDYVAWCFKAGGTPTATNTATSGAMTGNSVSIDDELQTSYTPTDATLYPKKISANTKLGFSTVLFTGTGDSNNKVPHGLDTPPELIIYKNIDEQRSWVVGTDGIDWTKTMKLQETEDAVSRNYFDNVPPTGNVFEIFNGQANTANDDGSDFIAYCFTSKRGVSKVGSYEGTGAAGNKVYTGFEPAFVMIKSTTYSGASWLIVDNKRVESNGNLSELFADTNSAESGTGYDIDFNVDGFTLNTTTNNANRNNESYIYYVVAKNTNETSLISDTDLELHLDADSFDGSTNTPTTWTDSSSNSNNGTITGATFDGELGNWLNFDGNSDYVTVNTTANTPIDASTDFSIEAWVNPTTLGATRQIITKYGTTDATRAFTLGVLSSGAVNVTLRSGFTSINTATSAGVVTTSAGWYHIALVRDGSDIKIYVNGTLSTTGSSSLTMNNGGTQPIRIGAQSDGTTNEFLGKIGQVRLYSSALTEGEIRQNYNFTKPSYPNGYNGDISGALWNPAGYFDFDGSNDSIDLDTSIGSAFWANNWSASSWVYFDSTSPANQCIFTSHGLAYNYLYTNNNTQLRYSNDNGVALTTSSGTISASQWHHIVVTRSSADGTVIYVDKVSVGTDAGTSNAGTSNASGAKPQIGAYTSTGSSPNQYPLDGRVSKFRLYNKALTQAEIDALHSEGE